MDDKRITLWHICVYAALVYYWEKRGSQNPFCINRREIMKLSHIHSLPTYHKYINEMVEFGFVIYLPSYNPFVGSLIWLDTDKI
ncbi:MAG TPA: hypothetical protein VKR53_19860 [Puia sp.]|nr:hypothetical protein [Puia sp.]